jgi:hypothetical protein
MTSAIIQYFPKRENARLTDSKSIPVLKHLQSGPREGSAGSGAKGRVPDTFQLGAISDSGAFYASRKINKLFVFNGLEYSDSHRRYHFPRNFPASLLHTNYLRIALKLLLDASSNGTSGRK